MRVLLCVCVTASLCLAQNPIDLSHGEPGQAVESTKRTDPKPLASIADFTQGMRRLSGFVDLFVDAERDRLFVQLQDFDQDVLYATAQASGLGSNPIGLDRGSLGPQHVIHFHRAGRKVLVLAKNLRFRALSDNDRERLAVAESFAPSVIGSLPVKAQTGDAVLVDATQFFLRDATNAGRKLDAKNRSYKVDPERSAFWWPRTKAFADNTEVEVLLTFGSAKPSSEVGRAANAEAVTLRQHHSFVRLPDDGYRARRFDPRVGFFGPQFQDYAAPLGESMHRHFIARHRLVKKDPAQPVSEPVEPIVYYIDPGTPEPVRSALRDGAMWWAKAFEAAGFRDAFRVEMLPADADPMDVRYNMIHWVHRRTRGWSYGASISDPRTGEILKGNVLLGSLRVRQDHLKFLGLQAPYSENGACAAGASPGARHLTFGDDALAQKVALMRIRQLAAHEVGHTLGLSHNFAASTYGRASVMDYPAPLVDVDGDELDFSRAYDEEVGGYDTWAIVYGYSQFAEDADEDAELERIIRAGLQQRYVLLTDQDARAPGSAHPLASLWDNGADPLDQLEQDFRVRAIGLRKFGINALRPGQSLAALEDALVPLYLHHRFQLEAAIKLIGGVDFRHARKGDGQTPVIAVPVAQQRRALALAIRTLKPGFLRLDPRVLARIPPAPPGYPSTAERFPRSTGQLTDPMAMASVAANMTIGALLHPQRLARLSVRRDGQELSVGELLVELGGEVFGTPEPAAAAVSGDDDIRRVVQDVMIDRLIDLVEDVRAPAAVRAIAEEQLSLLSAFVAGLADPARTDSGQADLQVRAHRRAIVRRVRAFLQRQDREPRRTPQLATPPGSPIGAGMGGR